MQARVPCLPQVPGAFFARFSDLKPTCGLTTSEPNSPPHECYLIQVDAIEVTGEMKNRHRLVSTILEPVAGRRAAGSRLDVMRVNDGRPYEFDRYLSWMTGKTIYVFFYTTADGGYEMNEQDPSAVGHPSAEIRKVIRRHNKRCLKNVSQQ